MDASEPTVVEVTQTRVRDGRIEGYCRLSDGTREWRAPSIVSVETVNDRTGERTVTDGNLR